jgi:crotonobetainyl-CoA:carnitine CoA-transferase CaiB-like acyl-CoA transferase
MAMGPLDGIRVIDISHSWAAPHCARILGDYGAEVIKVEYPRRLCLLRGARKEARAYDRHPAWFQVNRNKLSLTLNLKKEKDREVLRDLVRISDVFVENSRPGVMERLGFGYQDLVKIREELIVLSMSGFGNTGPYSSYSGYGAIFEAVGGIQGLTAYKRGERPFRIREVDVINGAAGACAVMTALLHRQITGRGQYIDLSQLETATHATIGEHLLEFAMNGHQTLPQGNRHWKFAPQGCYPCKGDDRWVTITVRSDDEWTRFCEVLGRPDLSADSRFATTEGRRKNHDEVDQLVASWSLSQERDEAVDRLQKAGIAAGAVLDVAEICEDPHWRVRNYFINSVKGSESRFPGLPFKLSEGQGCVRFRGPDLGQHNGYIVREILGRTLELENAVEEDGIGTAFDLN